LAPDCALAHRTVHHQPAGDRGPLRNDRHNYYLTCKARAEKLEAAKDEIVRRWGEGLYRRFRLYLWGSAYAFLNRGMEAYRVVLERPRET
jgi:cyclopropane-fatty-acyl-phospholipid synthase